MMSVETGQMSFDKPISNTLVAWTQTKSPNKELELRPSSVILSYILSVFDDDIHDIAAHQSDVDYDLVHL